MKTWVICLGLLLLPVAASAQRVVEQRPVILQLDVNAQGRVSATKVMPPTRRVQLIDGRQAGLGGTYRPLPEVLAKAAIKVASKWRFQPPRRDGKAVRGRTWAYDADFADDVRRALRRWKGEPMHIDGKAVATNIRLPVILLFPSTSKSERSRLEQAVRDVVKPTPGSGPLKSGQALAVDNPFVKQPAG